MIVRFRVPNKSSYKSRPVAVFDSMWLYLGFLCCSNETCMVRLHQCFVLGLFPNHKRADGESTRMLVMETLPWEKKWCVWQSRLMCVTGRSKCKQQRMGKGNCSNKLGLPGHIMFCTLSVGSHWGQVTHICVVDRCQAIIWSNAGILSIGPIGTNFSEILIGIQIFSFKKVHLKTSSAKFKWSDFLCTFRIQCLSHLQPHYKEIRNNVSYSFI